MSKIRFEGNLTEAEFPLMLSMQGKTVIQPMYDPKFRLQQRQLMADPAQNRSLPTVSYMENVLPTSEGVQSIGYEPVIGALAGATDFDQVITLRDSNENNFLLSPSNGKNYLLNPSTLVWASTNPVAGVTSDNFVTVAYVNGRTFYCYSGIGVYEYNSGTGVISAVALTLPTIGGVPLTIADVRGIGGSNNYLVIFTTLTVLWSSLVDPTDFNPSLTTGAGYATPQDVRGKITSVAPTSGGFVIFTYKNAVAATYTNNSRAPFAFKEIAGCGGVANVERITNSQVSGPVYIWGSAGLQKVTLQGAEFVSADVNDFIAGRLYDYWDTATSQVLVASYGGPEFPTKLALIANRWLCLSYKVGADTGPYGWSLVFDTALKRWGRLKGDHVDLFPFGIPSVRNALTYNDLAPEAYTDLGSSSYRSLALSTSGVEITSKQQMAVIQNDGNIHKVVMDYYKEATHSGVLILGKHQLVRAATMQHQLTSFSGAYANFGAKIAVSYDGRNMQPAVAMTAIKTTGDDVTYGARLSGVNYNLIATGTFALSSYVSECNNEGDS